MRGRRSTGDAPPAQRIRRPVAEEEGELIVEGTHAGPLASHWKQLHNNKDRPFDSTEALFAELYAATAALGNDPRTLKEALNSSEVSEWQAAWDTEIKQLQCQRTEELVDRE